MGNYWSIFDRGPQPAAAVPAEAISDVIPPALERAFSEHTCDPFSGLPYPLESTRLIIVDDTGKLVMGWTTREEWSLVGGISRSIPPGGTHFSDFRPPVDPRYTRDGAQLPASEQEKVVVESPLRGLMRECEEELTSDQEASVVEIAALMSQTPLTWFLNKVRDGRWTGVLAVKSGSGVQRFKTHVCLCRITLTTAEIAQLNAEIAQYPNREHREFASFPWEIRTHNDRGRVVRRIHVDCKAGTRLRGYDEDIVFGLYAADVEGLLA